ncbi:LysR family transcriptional regulator [Streptomyces sp. SID1328]|uniref:LysR family transcriptional regulator n=1 Tax=Streptomyces sp. SID1328 TaxID=2690250 RepID=UPI00136EB719|nr:LysR family transcriptional regulator [Streptomyces sp. SID1328]MYV39593.1 LysR family transcriptional regulator [Streptomyces sp. SID1328]
MDIDTKLLRHFEELAREGNLTRTAQLLFITQPSLTKQIRKLEKLMGVRLFSRSRNGMELTEAGTELAARLPDLLAGWDDLVHRTRGAARDAVRVLRVGFVASAANEDTQSIVAEFASRRPNWRVEMRQTEWSDPTAGLATGDVDVALLRLPFPGEERFHRETLITEPRWIALPVDHHLAHQREIAFEQVLDEPFVATPEESGWWRDYWLATEERHGRPVRVGTVARTPDEWLHAVAGGYGISLTPRATASFYQRPDVVYRPLTGVAPSHVGVVWPRGDRFHSVVRDFVESCLTVRDGSAPAPVSGAAVGEFPKSHPN